MTAENSFKTATDVVMVTGGSGFLGQHIVNQLQTKADYVKEVKVLDLHPYVNKMGHPDIKPVTSIVGSINDLDLVKRACQGVNSVIHVAGLVSFGTFPDITGMKMVNVTGTSTLITACLEANVQRLIFCSSVDVAIGTDDIRGGTEATTLTPSYFLFPGYPETKYKAECLVLGANGKASKNGTALHTMSLRANVMYGEGDPFYVTNGLRSAKRANGVLYRVGKGKTLFQSAYVGNTAWAFLCGDKALKQTPALGGQFFYIPDDSPLQNMFDFMVPYLACKGYRLSRYYLPYQFVYGFVYIAEMFLKLLSPLVKVNLGTESCSIKYLNMNLFFSGKKAKEELEFSPIFSPRESLQRSIHYYKNLQLE